MFVQNCSSSKEPAQLFPSLFKVIKPVVLLIYPVKRERERERKRTSISQLNILKFHFMEPLFISVKNVYLISFIRVFHNKNI